MPKPWERDWSAQATQEQPAAKPWERDWSDQQAPDNRAKLAAEMTHYGTPETRETFNPEEIALRRDIEKLPKWKRMLMAGGAGAVKTVLGAKQLVSDLTPEQQGAIDAASAFQESEPIPALFGDVGAMTVPGLGLARYAKAVPQVAKFGRALAIPETGLQAAGSGASYLGVQPNVGAKADFTERLKQAAIGGGAGLLGYAGMKGLSRIANPQVSPEVAALQREGITPTPGQILGGGAKRAEEAARSVPILGDVIVKAQRKGVEDFNRSAINRALNPVGESISKTDPVGYKAIENAYHTISGKYDDLLPKLKINSDSQFQSELGSLKQMAQNLNPVQAKQFNSILENEVNKKFTSAGIMSGETMKNIESKLGQLSRNYIKDADYDKQLLGNAIKETQDTLRRMVERNNPKYAGELGKINNAYANLLRVENAAAKSGAKDGVFSPAQLESATRAMDTTGRKRASSQGRALMQDLATAGESVLAQRLPSSGTVERALYGGAGLGAGLVNPMIPAGLIGGAGLYSQPAQKAIAALLTQRPEMAKAIGNRLSEMAKYGAAPAVGTAQGFEQ